MHRARHRIGPAAVTLFSLFALAAGARVAAASGGLDVGIVAAALPLGDGTGELALPFVVDVSTRDSHESATLSNGEVQFELRDADGRVRTSFGQPYGFASAEASAAPATEGGEAVGSTGESAPHGLRLYGELRLPPGSYTLDATVKDAGTGATGHASVAIRLPEGTSEAWIASTALVAAQRPGWRSSRFEQIATAELPYAFVDGGGAAFLPATKVELGATEKLTAQALIATPTSDFPFVVAELVDAAGRARNLPVQVTRVASSAYSGVLSLALELGPVGQAGDYRLRIGLAAAGGNSPANGPARPVTPIGADLQLRARAAGAAASASGISAVAALPPDANLTRGYRRLLALLAERGVDASAPELVHFELGARAPSSEASSRKTLNALRDAERAVIGELGAIEEEAGRPAEAEKWLRQGIARIEAQSLHLQLAFYLDRANRWTEATTVVNRLPVARAGGHASARLLYSLGPADEAAAARERVAGAVEAALPALRRSLGVAAAHEAGK